MNIEISNYTKVIKKATILENVNLSMHSGNIYGLRGVNGSGKTMLLRAVCGLIYPTMGKVMIDDEVLGRDISFPRSVGTLIENPAFLPNYTGFKNLQLIASLKMVATDEMIEEAKEETKEETTWVQFMTVLMTIVNFACLLSANLGMMNLLPIPALDGGRILFVLIEAIAGRPVPREKENIVTAVGVILLLLLTVFVFFNDLGNVLHG